MRRFGDYTDLEPPHAELALALAAEFWAVDDQGVERELQRLAERLAALTPTHALEALQWLGGSLALCDSRPQGAGVT